MVPARKAAPEELASAGRAGRGRKHDAAVAPEAIEALAGLRPDPAYREAARGAALRQNRRETEATRRDRQRMGDEAPGCPPTTGRTENTAQPRSLPGNAPSHRVLVGRRNKTKAAPLAQNLAPEAA